MAWQVVQKFRHIDIWHVHSGSFTNLFSDVTLELAGNITAYLADFALSPQSSHTWNFTPNGAGDHSWDAFLAIPKGVTTFNLSRLAEEMELPVGDALVYSKHNQGRLGYYAVGWKISSISGGVRNAQMIFYSNSGWASLNGSNSTFSGGPDSYGRMHYTDLSIFKNIGAQAINIIYLHSANTDVTPSSRAATMQNQYGFTGQNLQIFYNALNYVFDDMVIPTDDPYNPGGTSEPEEPDGSFDFSSEEVEEPAKPAVYGGLGAFINQYYMTDIALGLFGSWLWGGSVFDNLAKFFSSPSEGILNVGILPYTPDYDEDNSVNIKVGNITSSVLAHEVLDNYTIVDMGSITFDRFYDSALDQNPYSKCELYLPYCGTFELNMDEVMGHEINVKYHCDSLTGDCVAYVIDVDENRVLMQCRGNNFIQIPLSARDFSQVYTSAFASLATIGVGAATVAATGGMSAPVAVGMGTSIAANAMNSKTGVSRLGGFGGTAGLMSVQTPYVIMTIPRQCLPENQNEMQGYPLFVTETLGNVSGFTKVYEVHLDGLDCTADELRQIEAMLKEGVVL